MSPLDRCFRPKSRRILEDMVPLPDPGAPRITILNSLLMMAACHLVQLFKISQSMLIPLACHSLAQPSVDASLWRSCPAANPEAGQKPWSIMSRNEADCYIIIRKGRTQNHPQQQSI